LDQTTQTAIATTVVLAPAVAGALLLGLGRAGERLAGAIGFAGSLAAFACAVGLIASGSGGVHVAWDFAPSLGIVVSWRLDVAPLALAGLVSGVGALVLQFGHAYFGAGAKGRRAIATLSLFEAAMLGLVLADDLFLLFTFWELTGLCSFFLIQTDASERDDTFPAAQQALLVTAGGALPMLLGFIHLGLAAGTTSLSELTRADLGTADQNIALALVLAGVLSKSAQVPFHFWLPGAMAAPTPISAYLHSATMVKAGLILLLYFHPFLGESVLWSHVLVPLGVVTCVWGSWCALAQDDIKLLMAWSTVSQLGLMTMTLGLGTDLAIRAGALHLFAHAIFKAGLFLSIGAIDHAAHSRKLSQLGGLAGKAPGLALASGLLAGSMAGLPPFAGFLSKELVLEKLTLADPIVDDIAVFGILIGSIGTVAYSSRFFFGTFFGAPRSEGAAHAHAPGIGLGLAPLLLAALSLCAGLGASWTDRLLLEPFTTSLLGYPLAAPQLALWHGITIPFVLSSAIVILGYALHRWLGPHPLPTLDPAWRGPELFASGLQACISLGGVLNRLLAGLPPAVYLALALALGLGAGLPLVSGLSEISFANWRFAPAALVGLQIVVVGLLLILRDQLPRVLALTVVGFTVAMLYGHLLGPDLVLTQLLVDVLTTVFFVLALRFILKGARPGGTRQSESDLRSGVSAFAAAVFSLAAGLVAAGLVVAVAGAPTDRRLVEAYFEMGPTIAKGHNLVNVVLVDFRGFDTVVETIVVLLSTMGVVALLAGSETAEPRLLGERVVPSFLLQELSRLIVPLAALFGLALLLKGHDNPGGGFVAGLSLAAGGVLAVVSIGERRARANLRVEPERVAVIGALVLGSSVLLPLLIGEPMLTHQHGTLRIGDFELYKWTTSLILDIGVVLTVGGGLGAAAMRLWEGRAPGIEEA
jgi:multicomponent K+:H+ antiporter subunit A